MIVFARYVATNVISRRLFGPADIRLLSGEIGMEKHLVRAWLAVKGVQFAHFGIDRLNVQQRSATKSLIRLGRKSDLQTRLRRLSPSDKRAVLRDELCGVAFADPMIAHRLDLQLGDDDADRMHSRIRRAELDDQRIEPGCQQFPGDLLSLRARRSRSTRAQISEGFCRRRSEHWVGK